jgi:sulfur carrier protein
MQIKVNGKEINFNVHPDTASVADLLEHLKIQSAGVAVERNGIIVDRADYDKEELIDGDIIEIVRFVGGG